MNASRVVVLFVLLALIANAFIIGVNVQFEQMPEIEISNTRGAPFEDPGNELPDKMFDEDWGSDNSINLNDHFDDPEGDTLGFWVEYRPWGGHVTVDINNGTGVMTLSSQQDWNGIETLKIWARDTNMEEGFGEMVVTVKSVNDPPFLETPLSDFALDEDFGEDSSINLKDHFNDDGDDSEMTFEYEYIDKEQNIQMYDISNAAGVVTLKSKPNWHGTEEIKFTCFDKEGESASDTIVITINSINDIPKRTQIDFYSMKVPEGTVASWDDIDDYTEELAYPFLDLSKEFEDKADDADGYSLTFGRTYKAAEPNIIADVDSATGHTTISTEDENWFGKETITFWATDVGQDGIAGNADDAKVQADLIIQYDSVNDAVIFNDTGDIECFEDQWYNFTLEAYDNADGDEITFSTNLKSIIHGMGENYDNYYFNSNTGVVKILADNDKVGEYTGIWFQANDGHGSKPRIEPKITFTNVNDGPIARIKDLPLDRYYNTTMTIRLDASESEDDDTIHGDVLTYEWASNKSGDLGTGEVLNVTLEEEGLHVIYLNVTDSSGARSSVNQSILVIRERNWGEAIIDLGPISDEWTDVDTNDVFEYNATTEGMLLAKGNMDPSYDVTGLSYKTIGNKIEVTLETDGPILDSSSINTVEMNYYVYFVKEGHKETPLNVNVTVSRPKMYSPHSDMLYGWIGLINGKAKFSENSYTEDEDIKIDVEIEDNKLTFTLYLAHLERIGVRPGFDIFATSVCVVSIIQTATVKGAVLTYYDSVGEGSAKAPDKIGNRVFKEENNENEGVNWGFIIIIVIIVVAVLILIIIGLLVLKSVAKTSEPEGTFDYSQVRQRQDNDVDDYNTAPDDRYQSQNLYGDTGQAAPVGAVQYQQTTGQKVEGQQAPPQQQTPAQPPAQQPPAQPPQ